MHKVSSGYYAGHGHPDDLERIGFWVPVEGTREPTTWIDSPRIKRYLAGMKAKHVLLISDSCSAGDFFKERSGIPADTAALWGAPAGPAVRRTDQSRLCLWCKRPCWRSRP